MAPSELGIWLAMYTVEPWGERRADLRSAMVALQVSRSGGLKRQGNVEFRLTDFMPFELPGPELSDKDILLQQFGHRVIRKEG